MINYTTWAESLCADDDDRLLLRRPHALNLTCFGFTTTGEIALFVELSTWDQPLAVYDDPHGTLLRSLAPPHWYATTLGAILAWAGEPVPRRCDCDGKPVACRECDGTGMHECDCGDRHECGRCDSTGKVTCPECSHGVLPPLTRPAPLLVGGPTLDLNLVHKLLHACPDPPETKVEVGWNDGYGDPVAFRAAGWTGLIMPMSGRMLFDETPLIGEEIHHG